MEYKHAVINTNHKYIKLSNEPIGSYPSMEKVLVDVVVEKTDLGLNVKGSQIVYRVNFRSLAETDVPPSDVIPEHTEQYYANPLDWIKGKKSLRVRDGWFELKETKPYNVTMSTYTISIIDDSEPQILTQTT